MYNNQNWIKKLRKISRIMYPLFPILHCKETFIISSLLIRTHSKTLKLSPNPNSKQGVLCWLLCVIEALGENTWFPISLEIRNATLTTRKCRFSRTRKRTKRSFKSTTSRDNSLLVRLWKESTPIISNFLWALSWRLTRRTWKLGKFSQPRLNQKSS